MRRIILSSIVVFTLSLTAQAQSVDMKMATKIPQEITTPDRVETRIGTLNFKNGMPDKKQ